MKVLVDGKGRVEDGCFPWKNKKRKAWEVAIERWSV
jgi:hypothetical protein